MKELSPTAEAIRRYKLNASRGYEEWAKVSGTENYRMHVPSMGFNVSGSGEIKEVILGWLSEIEAIQELVEIVEFGSTVTCYLRITVKGGTVLNIVEVFKIDDVGRVDENLAL